MRTSHTRPNAKKNRHPYFKFILKAHTHTCVHNHTHIHTHTHTVNVLIVIAIGSYKIHASKSKRRTIIKYCRLRYLIQFIQSHHHQHHQHRLVSSSLCVCNYLLLIHPNMSNSSSSNESSFFSSAGAAAGLGAGIRAALGCKFTFFVACPPARPGF